MKDNISTLYGALKNKGYTDIGKDETEFRNWLNQEGNVKALYGALSQQGFDDIGDEQQFSDWVGVKKQPKSEEKTAAQIIREQSTGEPYTHKYDGQGNLIGGTAYETPEPYQYKPEVQKHISENIPSMFKSNNASLMDKPLGDSASLPELSEDKFQARIDVAQKNLQDPEVQKARTDAHLRGLSASVDTDLNDIEDRIVQRKKAVRNENWKPGMPSSRNDRDLSELLGERSYLEGAKELLEESQKIVTAANDEKDGTFVGGVLRGVRDKAFDVDNWTMGISDLVGGLRLKKVLEDYEAGKQLSPAQEKLLDAAITNMATSAWFESDLGRGYKAGQVTGESLPFMLEMMVNPISASGNAIAKSLLTAGLKRFGSVATNKAVKAGTRLATDALAATGMAATTGLPGVLGESVDRMNRNYEYGFDADGNLNVIKTGDTSFGEALGRSFTTRTLENQSEMIFNAFRGAGAMMRGVERYIPGGVNRFFDAVSNSKVGQLWREIKNSPLRKEIAQAAQIGGIGEEYLEEVYNNMANVALGEMSFEEAIDLDRNIDTFLGLAPTQVMFSMLGLGNMAAVRYQTRRDIDRLRKGMTEEQQSKLDELLSMGTIEKGVDVRGFIRNVMADNSLTPEQKRTSIEAAYDVAKQNAIDEITNTDIEDTIESENQQIDSVTDPSTGVYSEVDRWVVDGETGVRVPQHGYIVGWIGEAPVFLPEGMENTSENRVVLKPNEWNPDTVERMEHNQVKALNEEMIREESAAQAELESKYAPEVLSAQMQQGVPFNTPTSQIVPVSPMPEGNGWIVEEYAMDENGKPSKNVNVREFTNDEYRDMLQAQLDAEQAVEEELAQSSESVGEQVDSVVNTEVNNPEASGENVSPVEAQQPQVEAQQEPVIPTKEDGSIDFVTYGKEGSFKTLGERYGEKMPNKVAVTAKAFAEDVAKAQTKLDKAQEAYDNAPIGREEKAKAALDKAQQELDAIKREADFWAEMDAEIKSAQLRRSEILNPQVQTESSNEPMTADEFVAQQLAAGNIVLNKDDYMRETGFGSEEANAMNGGAKKLLGAEGMTIQEAGERLMEMDGENGTNFFDQSDSNAGRDALISVLGSVKSRKELNQYIANNRAEQAKRDSEGLRSEAEKAVMDANFSSLEDFVLQMEAAEVENPFADVDLDRIDTIFAEAEEEYQNFINNEQGRTSEIDEGNDNVLSEEQSDNTGRTEGIEDEGNSDGNVEGTLQQNEEAHAGEEGKNERVGRKRPKGFGKPKKSTEELFLDEKDKFSNAVNNDYAEVLSKSNSVEEAITEFKRRAEEARKRANEWRNRKYKENKTVVTGMNPYSGADLYETTIGAANERRREANVRNALAEAEKYESYASTLAERTNYIQVKGLQQQEGETILHFAERVAEENRRRPLRKRANEWSKALGVKVTLLESIDDVDARTRVQIEEAHAEGSGVPGWVAPNGEVFFFMPDLHNMDDVDNTYIHEVVAHIGLPKLLGEERFNEFCDKVWEMMPQSAKDFYEKKYPGVKDIKNETLRHRRAADEYIAHLAEDENLTPEEKTIWDNIVKLFRDMLDKALNGIIGKSKITNEDISNLIKASYANLKSGAEDNVSGEGKRFRVVYHGSAADFDKFDHSKMGSGAGSQVFGWGTYVSELEKIGRDYGDVALQSENRFTYVGDKDVNKWTVADAEQIMHTAGSYEEAIKRYGNATLAPGTALEQAVTFLKSTKKEDWQGKRHLYEVEIPDAKRGNYIIYGNNVTDAAAKKVFDGVYNRLSKTEEYDNPTARKELKRELDDLKSSYGQGQSGIWKDLYGDISYYLGSDKEASLFLRSLGYVGIKYPAGTIYQGDYGGASNYVIFDENDLQIVNHTRFRMTNAEKEELRDSEETKALFDYAKKRFGRTFDLREAGYILPDGVMLDFSGRHEMNPGSDTSHLAGYRSVDHRYVSDLNYEPEDDGGEKTGFETDMADFINRGAIRMDGNIGSINLTMKPTSKQKTILQRLIQRMDGDVWVDFGNGWDTEHSAEYSGVRPMRVLSDIDKYYDEGIKPEGNTRFRIANQNQEIFVSNAQRAVEGIKQEKGTPQQWLAMIEKNGGLKAGEDKWLGLSDWLKGSDKKSLTKDEILDFIGENKIRIEEVNYEERDEEDLWEEFKQSNEGEEAINSQLQDDAVDYAQSRIMSDGFDADEEYDDAYERYVEEYLEDDLYGNNFDRAERKVREAWNRGEFGEAVRPINSTRLNYTTEGLENKAEIALTVPTIKPWNEDDEVHFGDAGEGRAVAWIRFGETTTPNVAFINARGAVNNYIAEMREKYNVRGGGIYDVINEDEVRHLQELTSSEFDTRDKVERVLVIDEIQSKRHQEGREHGYVDMDAYNKEKAALDEKSSELMRKRGELNNRLKEKYGDFTKYTKRIENGYSSKLVPNEEVMTPEEIREWNETSQESIIKAERELDKKYRDGIPSAPFEKNWHELAMKRMLRYAAENGYDKVAWTTGAQQADRYNIGNSIDSILCEDETISEFADGTPIAKAFVLRTSGGMDIRINADKDGMIRGGEYAGHNISDVVGKELAGKMMQPGNFTISGEGLHIGGEGMKGFYDKMLPSFVNKYVKKWGTKVQDIELPNLEEAGRIMHSVDVTDAMKESVMEGQTMFRISDKGRKIQNEVDKFTAKYNSKDVVVAEVSLMSDEEIEEMFDAPADEVREAMGKNLVGVYDKLSGKIFIFVDNQYLDDLENSLFHENMHGLFHGNRMVNAFDESIKDNTKKLRDSLKDNGYRDDEVSEEVFVRVAANALVEADFKNIEKYLPDEYKEEFYNKIKDFGYEREQESNQRGEWKDILPGRRNSGRSDNSENGPNGEEPRSLAETDGTQGTKRTSPREQAERLGNLFGQVADMGLDGVLGNKEYIRLMVDIYKELPEDVRTSLADDALRHYGGSIAPAVSDYVNKKGKANLWDKIAGFIREALRKVGIDVNLNANDTKYILWRSRKPLDRNNLLDVAEDIDMRYLLKVGEHNSSTTNGSVLEQIKQARTEVEKNPTEAQKEAGNYKKGHITLDGYDITLENPKGGIRSGTDRNGKKWSITMNNDYGYIRGTEAVDGDHIDIFLSDNPIEGNVFVVDQRNEDGSFDESKVMYGFNSLEEARQAYLSNYKKGWESRIMAITEVSKDEFKRWIDSSHRKTKPFSEYKNVKSNGGGTRFRVDVGDKLNIRDEYEATIKKGSYQAREAVQDAMLSLRRVQELIEKASGKKLRDFENAWMHENRLSSVVQSAIHEMERKYYKPMTESVKKLMGAANLEQEQVADYLMLKHGIERNREMAVRKALTDSEGKIDRDKLNDWYEEKRRIRNDANLDTWRKKQEAMDDAALMFGADMSRDYSGLTSMFDTDDLADCTERAYNEVEALEDAHPAETEALGKAIKAMTHNTLDESFGSGLMDRKVYDELSNDMYDYYIPLRGFEETTSDEVYAYMDNDRGAFNAPLVRAKGRSSKSDNPIAYLKSIAESGIMQGERNKMKQTFLNMVTNHPSDLVSVREGVWAIFNPATGEWEAASFPESKVPRNATPADVDAAYQQWEADMEQRAQQDPNVKKISEAADVPYRVIGNRMNQHQVIVKRLGKSYTLTINGNPRLAMALNGLTNPNNTSNDGKVSAFVQQKVDALNRTLSAWYTTRNPDFVASNFMRDTFYTNTIVRAKEGNNYANHFHAHYAKLLMPGRMISLFSKYENGTLDLSKPMERDFHEFMMNGGETGYSNLKDLEHIKKQIAKDLKGGRLEDVKGLLDKLDLVNRAVENTARFAAYRTSRQQGRSVSRSIFDAKEISVNFNKKGAGGTFFGATGQTWFGNFAAMVGAGGRAMYVFFNAAIQGTTNLLHVMKVNPAGTGAGLAAMFLMGAVLPMLLGGDDEKDYYDLPEHVRRNHLILPGVGDSWISIPLPIEYRIMYGMGELLTSWRTGHERGSNIGMKMLSMTGQALPLNFLEEGVDAFMPSALSPLWQVYNNRSWTGLPIYKDNEFNKDNPEYTKAYKNVNRGLYKFTKALYRWTFDEENQEAGINLNPAAIEHIAKGYFGGLVTTLDNVWKTGEMIAGEREFDWRNIPVGNRIFKTGDERTKDKRIQNEYFENVDKLEFMQSRERLLRKTKDGAGVPDADKLEADEDYKILIGSDVYKKYVTDPNGFKAKKKKADKLYRQRKEQGDSEKLQRDYYKALEEANKAVR